ncbi:MAG: DNA polymerase III subunit gamma/tau [Cyanobacteria bacterium]|nr:DNA polymerase III subunit gamma/tau [Cyanobacteriota bacterium]MDW8202153.1 DNA polymerase III subunit gamma/tau [Cyanobacteriota bacterium SKYGB_h_bin112]
MAYEPLHHKYRPQTFAELVGQDAIATTLTNALRQGKIAPAYLFTGARGTGKTSSARILAKSLNCLSSHQPTAQPCGACDVCRTIATGSALDVVEIDAASNTGVDNIREVIERAQFAPVQCRYKVYVIDECHMLSTSAFNALLKTLEEPPAHVVFVLATTDPQRVLPTIISRCQRFDFRRIPLEAMVSHLSRIAAIEAIDITQEAVRLVAQIAQGGLRDAQSLLDQLSLLAGPITPAKVWDLVGAVPEQDLLALVQAIATNDAVGILDRARTLMDRGREPLIVLQNLAGFYRDLLIAKTAPDRSDLTALTPDTWSQLCALAQSLETDTILASQQHLRTCELQVKNTAQPRLWLEVALLGLLPLTLQPVMEPHISKIATSQPSQALTAKTEAMPQRQLPQPTTSSHSVLPELSPPLPQLSPLKTPTPKTSPVTLQSPSLQSSSGVAGSPLATNPPATQPDLATTWTQVMAVIHPLTRGLLSDHGRLLAIHGNEVNIGINAEKLLRPAQGQLKNMEAAFREVLGREVKVTIVVAPPPEVPTPQDSAPAPQPPASTYPPPSPLPHKVMEATTSSVATVSPASSSDLLSTPNSLPALPQPESLSASASSYRHDIDEVQRSAKNLAEWFGGVVVDLENGTDTLSEQAGTSAWIDTDADEAPF